MFTWPIREEDKEEAEKAGWHFLFPQEFLSLLDSEDFLTKALDIEL